MAKPQKYLPFESIENHFVHPIVWKEQSGNWHEMCLSRVIVTIDHRLSKNLVGIHNGVNSFLESNLNSQSQYHLMGTPFDFLVACKWSRDLLMKRWLTNYCPGCLSFKVSVKRIHKTFQVLLKVSRSRNKIVDP